MPIPSYMDERMQEIESLRAEVERLTRERDFAQEAMNHAITGARGMKAQRDAARAEVGRLREREGRLIDWCFEHGRALCPPGPDTYGEGMRSAKAQVRAILLKGGE